MFYISGGLNAIFCVIWWFIVYDSPADHPRISREELNYINFYCDSSTRVSSKVTKPIDAKTRQSLLAVEIRLPKFIIGKGVGFFPEVMNWNQIELLIATGMERHCASSHCASSRESLWGTISLPFSSLF